MTAGRVTKILCPEGELITNQALKGRVDEYLQDVRRAGEEFANGGVSDATIHALEELLYSPEAYMEMANASWEMQKPDRDIGEAVDKTYAFVRQMAAAYHSSQWEKDEVFELCFTDKEKSYQLSLEKDKCRIETDPVKFKTPTAKVETPFQVC